MPRFEISVPCRDCDGTGEHEYQVAPDAFTRSPCDFCNGDGYRVHTEHCESAEEAAADYPHALHINQGGLRC